MAMCEEKVEYAICRPTGFIPYFVDGIRDGKPSYDPKVRYALRFPTVDAAWRTARQIETPGAVNPLNVVRVRGGELLRGG